MAAARPIISGYNQFFLNCYFYVYFLIFLAIDALLSWRCLSYLEIFEYDVDSAVTEFIESCPQEKQHPLEPLFEVMIDDKPSPPQRQPQLSSQSEDVRFHHHAQEEQTSPQGSRREEQQILPPPREASESDKMFITRTLHNDFKTPHSYPSGKGAAGLFLQSYQYCFPTFVY
jgi:hypothetical protein